MKNDAFENNQCKQIILPGGAVVSEDVAWTDGGAEGAGTGVDEAWTSERGVFFLLAKRTASRNWMMTFNMRRKNAWLDVFEVKGAMLGNWRSMPPFSLVGAVTTTVSFVNL